MIKHVGSNVYMYGWMDSASVYFIVPMYGSGNAFVITRKDSMGTPHIYNVPKFIAFYNRYMHAVDVFDQI
jgi:hypothetical protein